MASQELTLLMTCFILSSAKALARALLCQVLASTSCSLNLVTALPPQSQAA